ncbi:SdpI family protein [Algoriphagus kandeliae]|uniref:SdpI family protein n=1 Tax=Algoriphagus kandeliae TaxID=2562278 RepID=A0A4Y9QVH7_9BACT|nr:SdpI family protein [Algoriphagus kandeliae]TFV95798.1 SdpI family protein [Algoriphagus kandeliae]
MSSNSYSFRNSALEKGENVYSLTDAGLEISTQGYKDTIPYSEIKKVRLYHDPTRFAMDKYQCDLTLSNGAVFTLKSVHYRGFGDFENRGSAYSAFLRQLHERLKNFPGIIYHSGNNPGCFAGNLLIIIGTVIMVSLALLYMGSSSTIGILIKLGVVVVMLIFSIGYMRKNKPATYSPDHLPEKLLPK